MKTKDLIYLVDEIYKISKKNVSSFNNKRFDSLEKLLSIFILERIVENINATKILLQRCKANNNLEPAIGLILRNNLSLCKIIFKQAELKDNNNNLKKFHNKVFGENICRTIKTIKNENNKKAVNELIEIIKIKHAFILIEAEIDLFDCEKNSKFNLELSDRFKNLSNLFVAFSKYEHFGLNTVILQNQNENDKFERIRIAIHYSLQGILICLNFLEITNERLQEININLSNKK